MARDHARLLVLHIIVKLGGCLHGGRKILRKGGSSKRHMFCVFRVDAKSCRSATDLPVAMIFLPPCKLPLGYKSFWAQYQCFRYFYFLSVSAFNILTRISNFQSSKLPASKFPKNNWKFRQSTGFQLKELSCSTVDLNGYSTEFLSQNLNWHKPRLVRILSLFIWKRQLSKET